MEPLSILASAALSSLSFLGPGDMAAADTGTARGDTWNNLAPWL